MIKYVIKSLCIGGILLGYTTTALASWEMIEDLCITKPQQKLTSFTNRIFRWSTASLGGMGGFFGLKKICDATGYLPYYFPKTAVPIAPTTGGIGTALIVYTLVTEACRRVIEQEIMEKFIASWPDRKVHTPSTLHAQLDALYKHYQNGSAYLDEEALDMLRTLRLAVYNHFPEKYREITHHNNSTLQLLNKNLNLTFDLGHVLTGLANLIKVFYKP